MVKVFFGQVFGSILGFELTNGFSMQSTVFKQIKIKISVGQGAVLCILTHKKNAKISFSAHPCFAIHGAIFIRCVRSRQRHVSVVAIPTLVSRAHSSIIMPYFHNLKTSVQMLSHKIRLYMIKQTRHWFPNK